MRTLLLSFLLLPAWLQAAGQGSDDTPKSDVFLQGFYWNSTPGGIWWDSLARLAPRIGAAGFGAVWLPPAVKGNAGSFSMGYDPYDHYDFGEYNQKGSVETRFGSRSELENAIASFHSAGVQVFADAVMGHMNGGEALIPVACEPFPSYPDSAWLLFTYPDGSGRFPKNASHFYPNQITCDVNPPYHGPYDPIYKFGEVLAHTQPHVRDSLIAWGHYLRNVMKFDGFRIDAVKAIDPAFIGPWLQSVGGYAVAEYYGSTSEIGSWLYDCQTVHGGDVSMFDFPLRFTLQDLCNNTSGSYDMTWLDGAGLISAGISGYDVATFVENHDLDRTGWDGGVDNGHNPILTDKDMAYGYILFSEGRPSVFWRDYFVYGLDAVIDRLIWIREKFLWGGTTERGGLNPWYVGSTGTQAEQSRDIYVARRDGGNGRPQCFLVMNDHATEWRGVWVNTNHPNEVFRDYTGVAIDKQAAADGRVELWAPPRGIAVYVPDTTQRVNHHPWVAMPPGIAAFTATTLQYPVPAGDLDGDSLLWQMSGNPAWISLTASGVLTGTPAPADTGTTQVVIRVSDAWGGSSADTFSVTVRSAPLMDGTFEGVAVWGGPVAAADSAPGWDGAWAHDLYVTEDPEYLYFGARVRSKNQHNWAFIVGHRSGGGSSDSWSRSISYIHAGKPDLVLRGHFGGYAEAHHWNGAWWTGVGTPLASTEFAESITIDSLQEGWVEGRIPKAAFGNPAALGVQFYLTGGANGNATFDACPDDQNTTGWTGSPTSLRHYARFGQTAISEVNLQFPGTATIPGGGSATIYARTYAQNLTDTSGAGSGILAWIGTSTANTNPATWTAWVPAAYNTDYLGADEYQAAIGSGLAGGTWYYASRFQYSGGPHLFGGYSATGGGPWNGTSNVSGVLTVQAAPAVPILLSPGNGATNLPPSVTLSWTGTAGATYRLQVSADTLFTSPFIDDSTLAATGYDLSALPYGTTWYWRVRAKNGFGSSAYSPLWSFSVFTPVNASIPVTDGWNMLSLPLTVPDPRTSVLFPTAVSAAYAFNAINGYVARDTLEPASGYWVKFPVPESVAVTGGWREADTVHLQSGWNLIGTLAAPVSAGSVVQIPAGIVQSLYYGFGGGYAPADTLYPGKAYWVKSAAPGKLFMSGSGGGYLPRSHQGTRKREW